jgi:photosystem II stability/assembly factor-like uncharacterized protein
MALTRLLAGVIAAAVVSPPPPTWTLQTSGVTARLRGVSASSANVVWASGSDGTVIRTEDGGRSWTRFTIPDARELDFRDIDAVDDRIAYVLSIGPGEASRVYKTADAGRHWTMQFRNTDAKAFYDAMAFRDGRQGFAFSDSVDGTFVVLHTRDGGSTWSRIAPSALPPALSGEGAYAASGTNVAVRQNVVWIATTASRVLRSADGGATWTVAAAPLVTGPSAGIFSIAFRDSQHGIVVGGDFKKEAEAIDNAAITDSSGRSWVRISGLSGYRSAVAYVPALERALVAVGPSGTDISYDDGRTWTAIPGPGFHAISFAPRSRVAWGVGESGRVARLGL